MTPIRHLRSKKITVYLLFLICIFGLAQCGDKNSKSKNVKFSLLPDDPIVINAELTLDAGLDTERTIEAPWFTFSTRVENNSDSSLNLVTYLLTISSIKNGQADDTSVSIDPSVTCDATTVSRSAIAFIPPGSTYTGLSDPCDQTSIVSNDIDDWYIGGLPDADSFFYGVEVQGAGWFVNSDGVAIERLIMSSQLYTQ